MTAVSIQSNKIISSEVKDNQVLLRAILQKKPSELSGQPNMWLTANPSDPKLVGTI